MSEMWFEDSRFPKVLTTNEEIIYDHSKVIVLSEMLYRCYNNNSILVFWSSIGYLKNNLKSVKDNTIIFIDVVPDNRYTLRSYEEILRYITVKGFRHVYVVPIPCIEYYAIKCFGKTGVDRDIVINRLQYSNSSICINNMSKRKRSFEKFCKAAMSVLVPNKFCGSIDVNKFNISIEDCNKLLVELPVFYDSEYIKMRTVPVNIVNCIIKQHSILIKQYELYEPNLQSLYDMQYLNQVFNSYIELIK